MMEYIATFYSHYGAVRFKKECEHRGLTATVMPVPRSLSSSCGTCVRFGAEKDCIPAANDDVEQIVRIEEKRYICIYHADED